MTRGQRPWWDHKGAVKANRPLSETGELAVIMLLEEVGVGETSERS